MSVPAVLNYSSGAGLLHVEAEDAAGSGTVVYGSGAAISDQVGIGKLEELPVPDLRSLRASATNKGQARRHTLVQNKNHATETNLN